LIALPTINRICCQIFHENQKLKSCAIKHDKTTDDKYTTS